MELAHKLADFASGLPMGKILGELDFSQPGILIGETACGKSMVTPVLAHLTGGFRRIIVRQPTRLASYLAMKSMEDIYGQSISVGCINRDQKLNPEAPILEVTDGILIDWLRDKQIWYDELVILDEIHATSEQLEIAMGLIKRQGLRPWCLSATIDPKDIKDYFDADIHYVSGINYPIRKKQIFKDLSDFLYGNKKEKGYIKDKIIEKGHSCLVFLPTRFETELWAAEIEEVYGDDIICKYLHGGINVQEMAPFAHKEKLEKPFILFSTPVAEQSITLDLDDVIIVNEKIYVSEYMGVKRQQRTPLPPNSLIQMMGRCGRYREGQVYVLSSYFWEEINFEDLTPTPVGYSLSNNTPYELAIILADRQVKLQDVELITHVDRREYNYAVKILKKRKIIDREGKLTKEGEVVMNIPLEYNLAQFVATAPEKILDIVIFASSFGTHGLYHMEKFFPDETPYEIVMERRKLAVVQSDLLTKYNIARQFYGLSEEEMNNKAALFGLNLHVITNALNAAKSVYEHLEMSPPQSLPRLTREHINLFQEHVFNIMLYNPIKVRRSHSGNSYSCYIDNMRAFTDSASTLDGGMEEVIFAAKTQVENRHGEWFIRLSDSTICPRKYWDWCWPEATIREFLQKIIDIYVESVSKLEKRYPCLAHFLSRSRDLSSRLEVLFNKSPGSFNRDRINFQEFLEDTLGNICIQERIKTLKDLESYLKKENIPAPVEEDFISPEEVKRIEETFPDTVDIRGISYEISYKNGEVSLELPSELIFELNEAEVKGVHIFTGIIEDRNGKIEKIHARSLEKARHDIKSVLTRKAWKKARKSVSQKVQINQMPNILTRLLVEKHITDFHGEPVYGWTGLENKGNKFAMALYTSFKEADKETKNVLAEYFYHKIRGELNKIKKELPQKHRKQTRKYINSKIRELEQLTREELRKESFNINSRHSFMEIQKKVEIMINEIKDDIFSDFTDNSSYGQEDSDETEYYEDYSAEDYSYDDREA